MQIKVKPSKFVQMDGHTPFQRKIIATFNKFASSSFIGGKCFSGERYGPWASCLFVAFKD